MSSDRWGAALPSAYLAAAGGLGTSLEGTRLLASVFESLGEHEGASVARGVAADLAALAPRIEGLRERAHELQPALAAREVEENRAANEAKTAREKNERLRLLAEQAERDTNISGV